MFWQNLLDDPYYLPVLLCKQSESTVQNHVSAHFGALLILALGGSSPKVLKFVVRNIFSSYSSAKEGKKLFEK